MEMVTVQRTGNRASISIEGEMTIFNAQQIASSLINVTDAAIFELDLSKVTEFDTSGFQILVALKKECQAKGIEFLVKAMSDAVSGFLDIFRMKEEFVDNKPI